MLCKKMKSRQSMGIEPDWAVGTLTTKLPTTWPHDFLSILNSWYYSCFSHTHTHSHHSECTTNTFYFDFDYLSRNTTFHEVNHNISKQRRAIAANHDSSSQWISIQEDTGAKLNIEGQHWISIGVLPDTCPGNGYIRCHCHETSNTARDTWTNPLKMIYGFMGTQLVLHNHESISFKLSVTQPQIN